MHFNRSTTLLLVPVAAAALAVSATPASGHDSSREKYRSELDSVNQPEADGRVKLVVRDGELYVRLKAKGLDDGPHLAHIHGIRQAENECPTMAADTDGNGFVDFLEGLPAYGPVQRTLSDGLNDVGQKIRYRREYATLDDGSMVSELGDLSQYAIVVHGVDIDGDGVSDNPDASGDGPTQAADNEISMPALCGTIEHHD